jgi:hypothetical protein
MVWGIDSQKPHGEHEFPLREECLALVQPIRRSHLPQVHDETTKGTRRTRQKKCSRAVVQRYVQPRVRWKMVVGLLYVRLEIF